MAIKLFAIKTFYRTYAEGRPCLPDRFFDPDLTLVEERILLFKAQTKLEAIKKAEKDANDFAARIKFKNHYEQDVETKYLGFYDIFEIKDSMADKAELFVKTSLVSKNIPNSKIKHLYVSKEERDLLQSKRKKFLNKDFSL